jgi:hypothetical protein
VRLLAPTVSWGYFFVCQNHWRISRAIVQARPRCAALTRRLKKKELLERLQRLNLHQSQIDESLEVLAENDLISGTHTQGTKFWEVKIELPGVTKIIRHHFPDVDSYYPQLIAEIVNGAESNDAISESLSLPFVVVNYMLDDLVAQGLIKVMKDVNGGYHISEVSAKLRRMARG